MWFPCSQHLCCCDHVRTIANISPLYLNNTRKPTERVTAPSVPASLYRSSQRATHIKRQGAVFVAVITFTDEWYFTWAATELCRMSWRLHFSISFPLEGLSLLLLRTQVLHSSPLSLHRECGGRMLEHEVVLKPIMLRPLWWRHSMDITSIHIMIRSRGFADIRHLLLKLSCAILGNKIIHPEPPSFTSSMITCLIAQNDQAS